MFSRLRREIQHIGVTCRARPFPFRAPIVSMNSRRRPDSRTYARGLRVFEAPLAPRHRRTELRRGPVARAMCFEVEMRTSRLQEGYSWRAGSSRTVCGVSCVPNAFATRVPGSEIRRPLPHTVGVDCLRRNNSRRDRHGVFLSPLAIALRHAGSCFYGTARSRGSGAVPDVGISPLRESSTHPVSVLPSLGTCKR